MNVFIGAMMLPGRHDYCASNLSILIVTNICPVQSVKLGSYIVSLALLLRAAR